MRKALLPVLFLTGILLVPAASNAANDARDRCRALAAAEYEQQKAIAEAEYYEYLAQAHYEYAEQVGRIDPNDRNAERALENRLRDRRDEARDIYQERQSDARDAYNDRNRACRNIDDDIFFDRNDFDDPGIVRGNDIPRFRSVSNKRGITDTRVSYCGDGRCDGYESAIVCPICLQGSSPEHCRCRVSCPQDCSDPYAPSHHYQDYSLPQISRSSWNVGYDPGARCGNNRCDAGEADFCACDYYPEELRDSCSVACRQGSCPGDCR